MCNLFPTCIRPSITSHVDLSRCTCINWRMPQCKLVFWSRKIDIGMEIEVFYGPKRIIDSSVDELVANREELRSLSLFRKVYAWKILQHSGLGRGYCNWCDLYLFPVKLSSSVEWFCLHLLKDPWTPWRIFSQAGVGWDVIEGFVSQIRCRLRCYEQCGGLFFFLLDECCWAHHNQQRWFVFFSQGLGILCILCGSLFLFPLT